MPDLVLPLKSEYFDAIKNGTKPEEFRLYNDFWRKRIEGRTFDNVVITKGYPKATDTERRITLPRRGYRIINLTHPHFGPNEVKVFAIDVRVNNAT